ncbi:MULTISPECIES: hypothetical protein [unclassified Campylobacter]|uniref:hypothetical protein n=1 Tax=unclassified Campylobacter TaxID=2593542 RepID=UPI0022E9C645|nr:MULTISPECIES: hypothetical protein [unclassified Campylobacter]MDA3055913.1 hypothetical protein [Campylobacter sp. CN_NA1]MDA3066129.1 hypothetical protein [Campylobacter sp. CN_NE4]MDA3069398.1 hypothetical protein [Campylobacter sp. CN_NE3]MDA3082512.1 hypothetical protein [Campylobacter sp. CN_EL2]MDA3083750.1 hypothetical protein [Campylobacter sp. CN_NE1]
MALIIFSGMPASGKDTITELLIKDDNFIAFKKHKSVESSDILKDTYYNISKLEFEKKIKNNDFLQFHERYGHYYGVERNEIMKNIDKHQIIHIGRIENYYILKDNISKIPNSPKIYHFLLCENAELLKERIINREKNQNEMQKRILALEQEFDDLKDILRQMPFDLVIKNTDQIKTTNLIKKFIKIDES